MLYRRTIDKQMLNINDIKVFFLFQSPLFSGFSKPPRVAVKMEDGRVNLRQVYPIGQVYPIDDSELQEGEEWQNINWTFRDEKDYEKHLKEEEKKKVYYIIGILLLCDKDDKIIQPDVYVLKKLKEG